MSHKHWCEIGQHEWECDGTQAVRVWAGETEPTPCEAVPDNGIELVSCPEHLAQDLEKFNVGQEIEDVFKIYHAIICEPDDSPAYKEAMRLLRQYIMGKD